MTIATPLGFRGNDICESWELLPAVSGDEDLQLTCIRLLRDGGLKRDQILACMSASISQKTYYRRVERLNELEEQNNARLLQVVPTGHMG